MLYFFIRKVFGSVPAEDWREDSALVDVLGRGGRARTLRFRRRRRRSGHHPAVHLFVQRRLRRKRESIFNQRKLFTLSP